MVGDQHVVAGHACGRREAADDRQAGDPAVAQLEEVGGGEGEGVGEQDQRARCHEVVGPALEAHTALQVGYGVEAHRAGSPAPEAGRPHRQGGALLDLEIVACDHRRGGADQRLGLEERVQHLGDVACRAAVVRAREQHHHVGLHAVEPLQERPGALGDRFDG